MKHPGERRRLLLAWLGLLAGIGSGSAGQAANGGEPAGKAEKAGPGILHDLLPLAWQKQPKVRFHVYTEMTPEGRRRRAPTPEQPLRFYAQPAAFKQIGWFPSAGEKPPPREELETAMRRALAANGYVPIADEGQRPDILLVFHYGSHGTDLAMLSAAIPPPVMAEELLIGMLATKDVRPFEDVVDRARFIAGERFARALQSAMWSPDLLREFVMTHGNDFTRTQELVELAFRTSYWVTATAYDFSGVEKKQKILLWQTRMTVEAQGVALEEILRPLIVNTGAFLGRETPDAVVVPQRIDREGRVEIGTPTVVEEAKAGTTK